MNDRELLEKLVLVVDALRTSLNDLVHETAIGIEVEGLDRMNADVDELLDAVRRREEARR